MSSLVGVSPMLHVSWLPQARAADIGDVEFEEKAKCKPMQS
jgi:hypothetical protein